VIQQNPGVSSVDGVHECGSRGRQEQNIGQDRDNMLITQIKKGEEAEEEARGKNL
jgi:signal-transduction protein with cAMP-binding, CBS, and nucleotidyltransferase domain